MSNLYGYSDYDGPSAVVSQECGVGSENDANNVVSVKPAPQPLFDDGNNDTNPLQAGFWMEGDSLAPPCGTSVPTIHKILEMADVGRDDVLYDLGCGDGRVCLEAWHLYRCRTIGIEVEQDLVDRAQTLIARLATTGASPERNLPRVYQMDLRCALDSMLGRGASNDAALGGETPLNLPPPTVIVLYLLPEALFEIERQLADLVRIISNCRIVCNSWGLSKWKAVKEGRVMEENAAGVSTAVFVYTSESLIGVNLSSEESL